MVLRAKLTSPIVALAAFAIALVQLFGACGGVYGMVDQGWVSPQQQDFRFVDKFCFDASGGYLYASVTPGVGAGAEQWILFYADAEAGWTDVYGSSRSCQWKFNQSALALPVSTLHNDPNSPGATLKVTGNRPRWWYVALANCDTGFLTISNIELTFHNQGSSIFSKHFSADIAGVYPAVVYFYVVSLIALIGLYWTKRAAKIRRRHHEALKSILWCVWFEHLSLLFQLFHLGTFARNGVGYPSLEGWAFFWNLISTLFLLQTILDISKGWVISTNFKSSRLNWLGLFLYFWAQAGVYLWGALAMDPALVVYIYESWAGGVLIGFRMLLMFYFVHNTWTSYGHERDHPRPDALKMRFYWVFGIYGTCWFMVLPLTVLIAHFLKAWVRAIVVTVFTFTLTWIFYFSIWYLFYPSHNSTPAAASNGANGQNAGHNPAHMLNGLPTNGSIVLDPNASRAFGKNTMQIFPELPMSSI